MIKAVLVSVSICEKQVSGDFWMFYLMMRVVNLSCVVSGWAVLYQNIINWFLYFTAVFWE